VEYELGLRVELASEVDPQLVRQCGAGRQHEDEQGKKPDEDRGRESLEGDDHDRRSSPINPESSMPGHLAAIAVARSAAAF
jgi:hypothetical protein